MNKICKLLTLAREVGGKGEGSQCLAFTLTSVLSPRARMK